MVREHGLLQVGDGSERRRAEERVGCGRFGVGVRVGRRGLFAKVVTWRGARRSPVRVPVLVG